MYIVLVIKKLLTNLISFKVFENYEIKHLLPYDQVTR